MKKLNIKVDGAEKAIQINEEFARGIYLVSEVKAVINNCKILSINLKPKDSESEIRQMVTKLGTMGILTIGVADNYLQCFIFEYADKDGFKILLDDFPSESKEALQLAYTYSQL